MIICTTIIDFIMFLHNFSYFPIVLFVQVEQLEKDVQKHDESTILRFCPINVRIVILMITRLTRDQKVRKKLVMSRYIKTKFFRFFLPDIWDWHHTSFHCQDNKLLLVVWVSYLICMFDVLSIDMEL